MFKCNFVYAPGMRIVWYSSSEVKFFTVKRNLLVFHFVNVDLQRRCVILEHSGYFNPVCVWILVTVTERLIITLCFHGKFAKTELLYHWHKTTTDSVLLCEGQGLVAHGLQVFGITVVGGAQMDAIVVLCCFQSFLPLARSLVEIVQQVIALTALVQLFCIFLLEDRKRWQTDKWFLSGKSRGLCVVQSFDLKRGHVICSQRMWRDVWLRFKGYLWRTEKISSAWILFSLLHCLFLSFFSAFECMYYYYVFFSE